MSEVARIILADDHGLVRAGLRGLIERLAGFSVIGEAEDGATALALVRKEVPEVVITDISMKGMGGLALADALKREFPQVRVIVLSMHADEEHVQKALLSGVRGYLLKDSALLELELALRAVLRGDSYLSPAVSRQVAAGYLSGATATEALTARQREILTHIAEGMAVKEIAFKLGISTKTVEAHRSQIMERLGIRDIPGLVKYALQAGLVSLRK
ncbi:MAG TPA: response regulator transcription factor [Burkholderiales bacterium]|nr:response regulator transcription factor [Burkholderiales bacterium]